MQPAHVSAFCARVYLLFPQGSHTLSALVEQPDFCCSVRVHSLQVAQVLSLARAYLPFVHA
jgi:hypothetical protein